MSVQTKIPPAQLRPLLHQEIDRLNDQDLAEVHRALLHLEARRLALELGEEIAEGWHSGKITEEAISEAVKMHRESHPYVQ